MRSDNGNDNENVDKTRLCILSNFLRLFQLAQSLKRREIELELKGLDRRAWIIALLFLWSSKLRILSFQIFVVQSAKKFTAKLDTRCFAL